MNKSDVVINSVLYYLLFQAPLPLRIVCILIFAFFLGIFCIFLWRIGGFEFTWVMTSTVVGAVFDLIALLVKFALFGDA